MTRALALTEKQARTLIRAAEKEKAVVEVKVGNTIIRLIPAVHAQAERGIDEVKTADDFQTLSEWKAWRDRNRDSEAERHP